ncbi:hypothetical protein FACS189440_22000 [Bacteroidia bacterium]|nr:hypothetical protein FACS189440_22000 [Bacteroidia bacterium]
MKTITKKILISLVSILLVACSNVEKKETFKIKFDFDKKTSDIHDIGLINDVQIINLDCEEVTLGIIDKIIRYKDRIYIMDKKQTQSIIIYDTLGHFINQISKRGNGPEEYVQLTDMLINPSDTTLNIISRIDKKILKYDLDANHFAGIEKLPKSFTQFNKTEQGYVGYMGNFGEDSNKRKNVWTVSDKLELENSFFEIDETWESINLGGGSVFSNYEDKTYYITPMDFNIYMINNSFSTAYTFDLGTSGWHLKSKEYETYRKNQHNCIGRLYNFQETQEHLIIQVLYNGQFLLGVYNKKEDTSYIASLEPYTGKYFFSFGQITGFDEHAIYTIIEASDLKRIWDGKDEHNDFESTYPEQIKRLREKFSTVREDGNPFLVIYSIN